MNPPELKYTKEHEWARIEGNVATIGVTHFAQDSLGDVVYIDVPAAGAEVKQFAKFGEIESVKAVSDLFAPLGGRVAAVNEEAKKTPELVNKDPYGKGWLIKLELSDQSQLKHLMDAAAYTKLTASGH
ncbi:MAG: glycine cleavage system protein GcvH [Dehalococcoidia bacterium]|nr:glycine cleavage system protein GcvH [Dehalococcoidia bacterium]MSQ34507.1 glycine cleavage system protein GcvH [Dehalococcoidia bacterium]